MGGASIAVFSAGGKLGLELARDGFGDLALDGEDIVERAVVVVGPELGGGARVDQVRRDAHLVARALDRAFQHVGDAELQPDLGQVAGGRRFCIE